MKRKSYKSFFVWLAIFTGVALLIALPTYDYSFSVGGNKFEGSVGGPDINYDGLNFELAGYEFSFFEFDVQKEFKIWQGLDLQGGLQLTYEADMSQVEVDLREEKLDILKETIDRRINALGIAEPNIQTSRSGSSYRIIVEMPGVNDVNRAKELIGQTAVLEFKELRLGSQSQQISVGDDGEIDTGDFNLGPEYVETGLTGEDFKRAEALIDNNPASPYYGQAIISFEFRDEAADRFSQLTERMSNEGTYLTIFLDEQILFQGGTEHIPTGEGIISGLGTLDIAKDVAIQLNEGSLPVSIELVSERSVSPTLGTNSIKKSMVAGIIGLAAVAIFMVMYYETLGVLAVFALLLYVIFSIAIFKLIPITMTLAGIAGFILSIGMAVDANILIFERFREELRNGKSLKAATEVGFNRAWSSIRDSNVASLITCTILFVLGSGIVRGFALTLGIGILLSMFTAIYITRNFMEYLISLKAFEDVDLYASTGSVKVSDE